MADRLAQYRAARSASSCRRSSRPRRRSTASPIRCWSSIRRAAAQRQPAPPSASCASPSRSDGRAAGARRARGARAGRAGARARPGRRAPAYVPSGLRGGGAGLALGGDGERSFLLPRATARHDRARGAWSASPIVLQDVTRAAPLRRAEEQPGRHRRARVPHAAHVAAHGHPPLRRGERRAAHDKQARPAVRGARGQRAAAADRRRPARSVAHPVGADGAAPPPVSAESLVREAVLPFARRGARQERHAQDRALPRASARSTSTPSGCSWCWPT